MSKKYADMTAEEKARHKEFTEAYRLKNPECGNKTARKYYHNNKEKVQARHKLWVEKNKESLRDKQRLKKRERKEWAISYLGGCCSKCGLTFHPAVYEFHHKKPEEKDRDPSKMLQLSLERLTAELDKCILLCANCHRLEHHKDSYGT